MGVYIPNMEKPKSCNDCLFQMIDGDFVRNEWLTIESCLIKDDEADDCPLIEIDEPKVGRWEECKVVDIEDTTITEIQSAYCPICHKYHTTPYMYYFDYFNYCPNCGTKMERRADEGITE